MADGPMMRAPVAVAPVTLTGRTSGADPRRRTIVLMAI
jgi:hypothetical protein